MTNKKQTKSVEVQIAVKAVEGSTVNNKCIENFTEAMKQLNLTQESSVSKIMLKLYEVFPDKNLNPNVLSYQIREFKPGCKCSANCISWYKNHYDAETKTFKSTAKKTGTKVEILEKLYKIDELKPMHAYLGALPLSKLKDIEAKYELA